MRKSIYTGISYSRNQISIESKIEVLTKYGFKCIFCGMNFRVYPFMFTVEHISHKYRGGNDKIENLAASCACCNSARGMRTVGQMVKYARGRRVKIGPWNPLQYLAYKNRNRWLVELLGEKSTDAEPKSDA